MRAYVTFKSLKTQSYPTFQHLCSHANRCALHPVMVVGSHKGHLRLHRGCISAGRLDKIGPFVLYNSLALCFVIANMPIRELQTAAPDAPLGVARIWFSPKLSDFAYETHNSLLAFLPHLLLTFLFPSKAGQ